VKLESTHVHVQCVDHLECRQNMWGRLNARSPNATDRDLLDDPYHAYNFGKAPK